MDFLGDVLGDIVSDQAGKAVRRMRRRFGPAPSGAGCALKIVSGSQDGLSQHWPGGKLGHFTDR